MHKLAGTDEKIFLNPVGQRVTINILILRVNPPKEDTEWKVRNSIG